MAGRPSWEGHLRLSLVTCPVALYPATSEAETVRFDLINPETNNRIRMQTLDAGTGEPMKRGDLVKGYAIAKDEYVILDKEDFESVKLESTKVIDIEEFVPAASIDRLSLPNTPSVVACLVRSGRLSGNDRVFDPGPPRRGLAV